MRIKKESLFKYLLNDDASLEKILYPKTLRRLRVYESKIHQPPLSIVDNLFLDHQDSHKSLGEISSKTGVSPPVIAKIFDHYRLPRKTSAEGLRKMQYDKWISPKLSGYYR